MGPRTANAPTCHVTGGRLGRRHQQAAGPGQVPTSALYREQFGWSVEEKGGRPFLFLGNGMVGVGVPVTRARAVALQLQYQDTCGPVLEHGGATWIFLADANGMVVDQTELHGGVSLLGYAKQIPLPEAPFDAVRWVVAPNPYQRWLPTLAAVLAAVRNVYGMPKLVSAGLRG